MATTRTPETTNASDGGQQDSQRSLWSRTGFVLSVVLVVLLVGAAVWLIATPGADQQSAPAPSTGVGQVDVAPRAGCGPAGSSSDLITIPAPDATWRLVGSMAAPGNPNAGPVDETAGIALCYSADPAGALFAAANFVAATSDPALRYPLFENAAAGGPGRDQAMLATIVDPGEASVGVQIAGFSIVSYQREDTATVDLMLLSAGDLTHLPVQLTWQAGDWRVELPPTGALFEYLQPLTNANGYTAWQGA